MSQTQSVPSTDPIKAEVKKAINEGFALVGDALPENNYWVFAAYMNITPFILKEFKHILFTAKPFSGPLWNYVDSACSVMVGVSQLADEETHRPDATKVKGVLNILNGVQLTTLTAVSFAAFGGPGFAAAFGIGFALSLDDTARAIRRANDDEYWLKDSLAELEKIEALLKSKKLKAEIDELESIMKKKKISGGMSGWALERKKERLKNLEDRRDELREDILTRVVTMRNKDTEHNYNNQVFVRNQINAFSNRPANANTEFKNWLDTSIRQKAEQPLHNIKMEFKSEKHIRQEKNIQQKDRKQVKTAIAMSVIWGIAFTGMLISCIPGLQLVGLGIVAAAAGIYFAKNTYTFGSWVKSKVSSLFSNKDEKKEEPKIASPTKPDLPHRPST